MRTVLSLLLLCLSVAAQTATLPLILEGNAPIVELEFRTAGAAPRMARFLIDSGGGSFILISGKPLAAIALQLQGKAGSTKRLKLERDGKAVTVKATVQALL